MNPYIFDPLFDDVADLELEAEKANTPSWRIDGSSFERLVWARATKLALERADNLLKTEVDRVRNNLISEIEWWVTTPDILPPGDRRIHGARGAVIALNRVLDEWSSYND